MNTVAEEINSVNVAPFTIGHGDRTQLNSRSLLEVATGAIFAKMIDPSLS